VSRSCDFCGSATGAKVYTAQSFIMLAAPATASTPPTNYVDSGEWKACGDCSAFIDRKEWKNLMDRAKRLNPGLRAAYQTGQLDQCAEFIAKTWAAVFNQPERVFLEWMQ
jgi:hypothetical protein